MSKIEATVVADSTNPQNDRLTSVLVTMPRIILSEMNTHRMLSKNTSSSRAIPFKKMVEAVRTNPFIPIAWQKKHKGMQGREYITDKDSLKYINEDWLEARDSAVEIAQRLNIGLNKKNENGNYEATIDEFKVDKVTKQLCNRLLEPFMWTTMLITGSKEGWENFFSLRCPQYSFGSNTTTPRIWKSRKDAVKDFPDWSSRNDFYWNTINKGQAEIHMMALAECIYDAMNESIPKKLAPNEWHIPFSNKIPFVGNLTASVDEDNTYWRDYDEQNKVKISVASAARTSYTVVGEEKEINFQKMIELHDRLISQDPPHSSPMEHACQAVTDEEYNNSFKGQEKGWFRNYKGFKSYRQVIEESK